jgi:hypothetical protein
LVTTTETAVMLKRDGCIQDIERNRNKASVEHPTVGQVERWFDPDGKIGLLPEARALIVRCYARAMARTLADEFRPGKPLRESALLERPDMPEESQWLAAQPVAGMFFGVALAGRALQPENLKRFAGELDKAIAKVGEPASRLPGALREWNRVLGIDESARLTTAESGERLIGRLRGRSAADQVRELAKFEAQTSPNALSRSLGGVVDVLRLLDSRLTLGVFGQLMAARETVPGVADVCLEAAKVLRQDELNESLPTRLEQLAAKGQELLRGKPQPVAVTTPTPVPEVPKERVLVDRRLDMHGTEGVLRAVMEIAEQVRLAAERGEVLQMRGSITITRDEDG